MIVIALKENGICRQLERLLPWLLREDLFRFVPAGC